MDEFRETRSLRGERQDDKRQLEQRRQARRQAQLKRFVRWAAALGALAAAIVVGRAALGPVRLSPLTDLWNSMGRASEGFPLDFSFDHTRQAALAGQSIALLGPTQLEVVTRSGYKSLELNQPYSAPAMEVAGGRIALYDRSSGNLMLLSRSKLLYTKELSRDIYCVDINKRGDLAAATKSDTGSSEIYAWDTKEKQRFAWRCEKEYPSALQLAEHGRSLGMCLIGTAQAGVYSRFVDYPFNSDEPRTDLRIDGVWLYGAAPVSGGWLAVGDEAVYQIKNGAEAPVVYSYEGRALAHFDSDPGGYTAVLLVDWDNCGLLRVYDKRGNLALEQQFQRQPLEVSCQGNAIYLRFDDVLLRWRSSSGYYQSQPLTAGTQGAFVSGRDAYVLTVRHAEQLRLHWTAPEENAF